MHRFPRVPALAGLLLAGALLAPAGAARAQGDDSATVKLIQLLIAKGILTRDQAASLLTQAQSEARSTRAPARTRAGGGALATAEPPAPVVPQGTVRVTYVPQSVRDQIAQQVRDQVLDTEQKEGWAAPNALPDWTKRITIYGDIRLRGERVIEDPQNKESAGVGTINPTTGAGGNTGFPFTNYNAINTGSPFDLFATNPLPPPQLNTTEDRTRFRIRAHLGARAEITDWLTTDFRLATGNDTSPVTENQTLGQGSAFGKYAIWLDRAYALLHVPGDVIRDKDSSFKLYAGRFGNPFWTTDLEFDDNVNFDGAALQLVAGVAPGLKLWGTGGGFVLYNTDFNYGNSNNSQEFPSRDKYLFAGQIGADYQPTRDIITKFSVGLLDYSKVEGQLSSPCDVSISSACNSDNSRPLFQQFGNTVFPIRNIIAPANFTGQAGTFNQPQYYGLASRFDVLDLHGRVQLTHYDPIDVELEGEFAKNLGFNRRNIIAKGPTNNFGNSPNGNSANPVPGPYVGGDTAWMAKLEIGKPEITKLNEWNAYIEYKYIESDAVLDGLTDSNFHFGGTNAKGFILGADYGIGKNTYLAARWYSASQVSGPHYGNDIVQIDLNSKF